MANTIILKHKDDTTDAPLVADLSLGEIALNTRSGAAYMGTTTDGTTVATVVEIGGGTKGAVVYQGTFDASGGTEPVAPATDNKGFYWDIIVAGTFSGIDWKVGDLAISSGTAWQQVQNADVRIEAITGNLTYVGAWDLTTPADPVAPADGYEVGQYWIVSKAGNYQLGTITAKDWEIGDWAVMRTVSPNDWDKIDNTQKTVAASEVTFAPTATVTSTDVQTAITEVDGNKFDKPATAPSTDKSVMISDGTVDNKGEWLTKGADGTFLSQTSTGPVWAAVPGGVSEFLQLDDVSETTYVGKAGQIVVVNTKSGSTVDGDELEFTDTIDGGTY